MQYNLCVIIQLENPKVILKMAIEWINPLKAPAERTLQVLSAFCFVLMIAFAESVTIFIFVNLWVSKENTHTHTIQT